MIYYIIITSIIMIWIIIRTMIIERVLNGVCDTLIDYSYLLEKKRLITMVERTAIRPQDKKQFIINKILANKEKSGRE